MEYTSAKKYDANELVPRDAKIGFLGMAGNYNRDIFLAKVLGEDFQKRIGANVVILSGSDVQSSVDYVIQLKGGVFQCPGIGANAADAALNSLAVILLPVPFMVQTLTTTSTDITVVNTKSNKKIGKGLYSRVGQGMAASYTTMMDKTADFWDEKIFTPKKL
jgi:hypothetical protein